MAMLHPVGTYENVKIIQAILNMGKLVLTEC